MTDQPCEICGKPNAPFGYGPAGCPSLGGRRFRSRNNQVQ
jgi:hypothetical protein